MKLTIDFTDLRPEYVVRDPQGKITKVLVETIRTKFEHFDYKTQKAITLVGSATYWYGGVYNRVYPPKPNTEKGATPC